jgi:hypothetical protein
MPKPPKRILTRSYFKIYIPELIHNYCPCCDDIIMTSNYVDKHLNTNKHKLNVNRLKYFIRDNSNSFVKENVILLNEVCERYGGFGQTIINIYIYMSHLWHVFQVSILNVSINISCFYFGH